MKYRKASYVFFMVVITFLLLRSFPKMDISTWSLLLMSEKEANFLRTWSRVQRTQLDVNQLLGPCKPWQDTSPRTCELNSDQTTDVAHSSLSGEHIRPAGDFSRIFITTRNISGHGKSCGGDYWKVSLKGPSFFSASVFDLRNGTYEIVFLPVTPGMYKVHIVLVHSLCQGIMDRSKSLSALGKIEHGIEIPKAKGDPLLHRLQYHMRFRDCFKSSIFQYQGQGCYGCCSGCKFLWNGYGTWENELGYLKWRPYIKTDDRPKKVNYRKHVVRKNGSLLFFGDRHLPLYQSVIHRPLCGKIFKNCEKATSFYPEENFSASSVDHITKLVLASFTSVLKYSLQLPQNALILNSAFIRHLPYNSYTSIVDKIAQLIRDTTNGSTHAQIIWSTITLHQGSDHTSHIHIYNAYTNRKMCDAKIPILDLFPLTDSHPHYTNSSTKKKPIPYSTFESVERLLEDFFERTTDR